MENLYSESVSGDDTEQQVNRKIIRQKQPLALQKEDTKP